MDMSSITRLLPEFLSMFKNGEQGGLQDIVAALGNNDLLSRLLGGSSSLARFLPLLPLLSRLNTEGFKGLLNNSDDVTKVLSMMSGGQSEGGQGVVLANFIQLLPSIATLFRSQAQQQEPQALPAAASEAGVKYVNPFYYISDIADKEILSALARYISRNSEQ